MSQPGISIHGSSKDNPNEPHLEFNPDTLAVTVELPAGQDWTLTLDSRTSHHPHGGSVLVTKPAGRVAAVSGSTEWAVDLSSSKTQGHYIIQDHPTNSVHLLTRMPQLTVGTDLGPVEGWQGWVAQRLATEDYPDLVSSDAHWQDSLIYPYLRGPEGSLIYQHTPKLTLAEGHEWTVDATVTCKDGTVLGVEGLTEPVTGKAFDVFEEAEDPWVGRFTITISRDGEPYEVRTINLVEALVHQVEYPGTALFGAPDLEPLEILFHTDSDYLIVEDEEFSSDFDPDSFYLPYTVKAPALRYLMPLREDSYHWTESLKCFDVDDIDPDGELKIRFPHRVQRAELRVGEETLELNRVGESTVWTCSVSRLIAAQGEDLGVDWYLTKTKSAKSRHTAPLAKISRTPLLEACAVVDGALDVTLSREPLGELSCRVWPVQHPLDGAYEVEIGAPLPSVPGPFIVQVKDLDEGEEWDPQLPGAASRVAAQDEAAEAEYVAPGSLVDAWNTRFALRGALAFSGNRNQLGAIDQGTSETLCAQPRAALDALAESLIPVTDQAEEFIRSGLAMQRFEPGDSTAEGWLRLIQELNNEDSDAYLRSAGAPLLPAWKAGTPQFIDFALKLQNELDEAKKWNRHELVELKTLAVPSLISAEERKAALAQLADNRSRTLELRRIPKLIRMLDKNIAFVRNLRVDAVIRSLGDLEFVAKNATTEARDLWLWVPYISAACAFLARMEAYELAPRDAKFFDLRHTWAQLARFAPRLVAYDLVCAEAVVMGQAAQR